MTNIESYDRFIALKKQKEEVQKRIELEQEHLILANKNGYETYRDYEYSMYKAYSRDPRFTLSREYYNKCQRYLIDTLNAYLIYVRTGSVYNRNNSNEGFILTIYALNELCSAILEKNELILEILANMNLDPNEFVSQIADPQINVKNLKIN